MKVFTKPLEFIPEYDMRSICPLEEMLLFDIETTGLKKETSQVYLIGCCFYQDDTWHTKQWLTESTADEQFVLEEFLEFASHYSALVHFNGEGFDIPYINYKSDYYCTEYDIKNLYSFDIYKHSKTARKLLGLSSMSQRSVEKFLGIEREDRYNGGLLIPVYYEYEKSSSPELEKILLLHNFDDLQGMLKILPVLSYPDIFENKYFFTGCREEQDIMVLDYRLFSPVPVSRELMIDYLTDGDVVIYIEKDLLQINMKIYKTCGRVPLPNTSDYYYLPEEDMVIHKDLAKYVDKSSRVKANKKNCFLKKEGRFIPQLSRCIEPVYYFLNDNKRTYADVDDLMKTGNTDVFERIADDLLQSLK